MITFYRFFKAHFGYLLLSGILLLIIFLHVRPGYLILGNDNFSPELDPKLSLERSLFSPAWRTYRVLGVPSDSEQSDLFRSAIFTVLSTIFPSWALSQGYLFFAFFMGSFSMGHLVKLLIFERDKYKAQLIFLFGGLFYLANLLTSWVFFYPLHLFVAAYAFLPTTLWRVATFIKNKSVKNGLWLLLSSLFISPSALTATMFLMCSAVIVLFTTILIIREKLPVIKRVKNLLITLIIFFSVHLYWIPSFGMYVLSNTSALRESAINKDITATQLETETKYNTWINTPRYISSWMDIKEDGINFTFPFRNWYLDSPAAFWLSLLPVLLASIGLFYSLFRRNYFYLVIFLTGLIGWFLIKGDNSPLGSAYAYLQEHYRIFSQVFRWQSSKFWPLLATTLPPMATLGTTWLLNLFKRYRKIQLLLLVVVGLGLLYYIHPYFRGDFIRKDVYVKVPDEYYHLANFLKKNDPHGRIYLSPEANTVYFRNYEWGFWGSVVLNYIIPNPIIEKALVIGSRESEQAFQLILSAYYSNNPLSLVRSLSLYDVDYVLADRSVSKGKVGYVYDWFLHEKMIDKNPAFEKIWTENFLTLYKLKSNANNANLYPLSEVHDWTKVNNYISQTGAIPRYVSQRMGNLYPLYLDYADWRIDANGIVGQLTYDKAPANYELAFAENQIQKLPIQVSIETNLLNVQPELPDFRVNGYSSVEVTGGSEAELPSASAYLTLDSFVSEISKQKQVFSANIPYEKLVSGDSLYAWSNDAKSTSIIQGDTQLVCNTKSDWGNIILQSGEKLDCATPEIELTESSVVTMGGEISVPPEIKFTWCLWSLDRDRCLNQQVTTIGTGESKSIRLIGQEVFAKGDRIKVFVKAELLTGRTGTAHISSLDLNLHSKRQAVLLHELEKLKINSSQLSLKAGDELELVIPYLTGVGSWSYLPENMKLPEISTSAFDSKLYQKNISLTLTGLKTTVREGSMSLFQQLPLFPTEGMAMLAYEAENTQGIPTELSLRHKKQAYKTYVRRIDAKASTAGMDLILMPAGNPNLILEAFLSGVGPRSSVNELQGLVFQKVPEAWLDLQWISESENSVIREDELVPKNSQLTSSFTGNITEEVMSIPTAVSPYWHISNRNGTSPTLINGWKQAWKVTFPGVYSVTFLGNSVVYIGITIGLFFLLMIFLWIHYSSRYRDPHHHASSDDIDTTHKR